MKQTVFRCTEPLAKAGTGVTQKSRALRSLKVTHD